ncbi:CidA/LrgA family holin-like protein [Halobacillus sp. A1]|uniref:CidA/LrgA family protein n=1 Tax=Halobacillus sp. A1 TaxID=2880262 RepID=UPI0020A6479A|nr:CidA/LrgA family holin-like protein [Halobacillus sp. A1]MCP3033311.1 CidA/LrgA family holin-like protein [Halobacillus sp. A1]
MKLVRIIVQIAALFIISFIGEEVRSLFNLPIPGSIIGLILLFFGLSFNLFPEKWIEDGAKFILAYLPMFFIPATAGVIQYPSLLSFSGAVLVVVVIISSLATMAAAGSVSEFFQRHDKEGER